MLRYIIKQFKPKENIVSLGRWEHRICDNQRNIKITWANSDNCGDIICGNPKDIKYIVDGIKKDIDSSKKDIDADNTSNTKKNNTNINKK